MESNELTTILTTFPPIRNPVLADADPYSSILTTFANLCGIRSFSFMKLLSDGVGLYSTMLTTFTNPLEIRYVSFMNLLLGGFGRHGPIFHYSGDLHTPIRNLICFIFRIWSWAALAAIGPHFMILRTFTIRNSLLLIYEFAPGRL